MRNTGSGTLNTLKAHVEASFLIGLNAPANTLNELALTKFEMSARLTLKVYITS